MYLLGSGPLQAAYGDLWKRLVPKSGPAATVQGELVRSATRLAWEYYRNANASWAMEDTRQPLLDFAGFIERTLLRHGPADLVEHALGHLQLVRAVGLNEAEIAHFEFDPWDELIHNVVEWCLAHPKPLLRASPKPN